MMNIFPSITFMNAEIEKFLKKVDTENNFFLGSFCVYAQAITALHQVARNAKGCDLDPTHPLYGEVFTIYQIIKNYEAMKAVK